MIRKAPPLRRLAIHVEEPRHSGFRWILSEVQASGKLAEVERANSPAKTYRQAVADGLRALQAMVEDLNVGPRLKQEVAPAPSAPASQAPKAPDEDESPNDPVTVTSRTHSTATPRPMATAFGFGLPS